MVNDTLTIEKLYEAMQEFERLRPDNVEIVTKSVHDFELAMKRMSFRFGEPAPPSNPFEPALRFTGIPVVQREFMPPGFALVLNQTQIDRAILSGEPIPKDAVQIFKFDPDVPTEEQR